MTYSVCGTVTEFSESSIDFMADWDPWVLDLTFQLSRWTASVRAPVSGFQPLKDELQILNLSLFTSTAYMRLPFSRGRGELKVTWLSSQVVEPKLCHDIGVSCVSHTALSRVKITAIGLHHFSGLEDSLELVSHGSVFIGHGKGGIIHRQWCLSLGQGHPSLRPGILQYL
jgi:hypothetical protein